MPSDVREADGVAAGRYKVPSVVLMENAARAAADKAEAMARGDGPFVILAGHGNNGGDGFAAAPPSAAARTPRSCFENGGGRQV